MKCVILGAGLGKRLFPLTQDVPKPMMPVVNRPVLEHIILALRNAGIRDIFVNLFYLPERLITYFGDGEAFGVHITWKREQVLSGPAGALLVFEDLLKDEEAVLVVSGDTLQDINLQALMAAHRQIGAQLTVVMKEIRNPGRYGVGSMNKQGFLTDFVEKPPLSAEASGLVSCGIYCLDPKLLRFFRRSGLYDFGADLIPEMVSAGQAILGFKTSAYWTDIGTPHALLDANLDALAGKVQLDLPGELLTNDGIRVEQGSVLSDKAHLTGPLLIGKGAKIGPEAHLVGPAVIGASAIVGRGAYVSGSLLLPGSLVPDNTIVVGGLFAAWKPGDSYGSMLARSAS